MRLLNGIGVVAGVELRQRLRAGRWQVMLLIWFLVLAVVTLGLREIGVNADNGEGLNVPKGAVMFGGLSLFLLVVALLVVPALSAQSVNGDRERGVLATLQVTDLSPWEITLGKFAASWGVAVVFLLVSLPLDIWAMVEGGVGFLRFVVVTVVQALLLGVVAAVSLALSALLARTTTSAVLSYLAVLGLTVGTLIVFGLATTLVQQRVTENESGGFSYTDTVTHTERIWWLLAPNPVVIMVDASPRPPDRHVGGHSFGGFYYSGSGTAPGLQYLSEQDYVQQQEALQEASDGDDPLRAVRNTVRGLRVVPDASGDKVGTGGAVWPWGLGFDVALAVGALVLTERRLRTPARTLTRGTRVA